LRDAEEEEKGVRHPFDKGTGYLPYFRSYVIQETEVVLGLGLSVTGLAKETGRAGFIRDDWGRYLGTGVQPLVQPG